MTLSIRTPLVSHTYLSFHSQIKSKKHQPKTLIVSISRIKKELHERIITRKIRNQEEKVATFDLRKPLPKVPIIEKIFNSLETAIIKYLDTPLHLSVDPSHILSDNFAPVDELSPTECKVVHGSIPSCLNGVYIRNGPNPQFIPNGPHHFFDGDGMVHCIKISQGRATFCSRYVKTNKYLIEQQVKSCIVPKVIGGMRGLSSFVARATLFVARVAFGHYDICKGIGVANTSLALLGGQLCALCESDIPYAIEIKENGDVITLGHHDFDGKLSMNMTAHPKIDPETKEAFAFRYWATRPYVTYFRFDANGNKQPDVPIFSMNHPSLTHDLAITQKYAIICEIQIGTNPMNLVHGERLVGVDPKKVPRIGVLPRYAKDDSEMKWFEVPNFNIFHAVNAWEEIDEDGGEVVVMVAPNILFVEHFFERADLIHGSMEKVKINIETGVVSRHIISNQNLEFPVINPTYVAKKNKYIYAATSEPTQVKSRMLRVSGVVKLDMTSAENDKDRTECVVASRMYGNIRFGGEPFFVARNSKDPNAEEDDGYVVSYMHNERSGESSFMVMDAQSPTLEVVAEVKLPQRVPYGLHGIFIKEQDLNQCDC
ncbi:probable carotenoid cleavage dioxygenase 4, chloroplastic [Rutidosis leptorrhynchoides]|uniref:probable carotenoid cleavage dioxygenase 4, chloroplastic n=1 Tax=Rutidosis leptorrhynchoides TaxID=125765 RepID=UPI003A9919B2